MGHRIRSILGYPFFKPVTREWGSPARSEFQCPTHAEKRVEMQEDR